MLLLLTGCASVSGQGEDVTIYADTVYGEEERVVTVERASITPVVSAQTNVVVAPSYVVVAPVAGKFSVWVKPGEEVAKGTKLGMISGQTVIAPTDAIVVAVYNRSSSVPANYPLVSLQYDGFAVTGKAEAFLESTNYTTSLTGRFQIEDGVGPSECASIVLAEGAPVAGERENRSQSDERNNGNDTGEETVQEAEEKTVETLPGQVSGDIACLISKDDMVFPGQVGTVVFSTTTHEDVLAVPLSAVAGRIGKGNVTQISDDGTRQTVEVQLGVSDGSRVEILSGLEEGAQISSLPPHLDPRSKR